MFRQFQHQEPTQPRLVWFLKMLNQVKRITDILTLKTVEGPDDFAFMEEVVYRRYKRLKEQNEAFPQLIVIDGGKGQLSPALKALDDLELEVKLPL